MRQSVRFSSALLASRIHRNHIECDAYILAFNSDWVRAQGKRRRRAFRRATTDVETPLVLRTLDESPYDEPISEVSPLVRTYAIGDEIVIAKSVHREDVTAHGCLDDIAIVKLASLCDRGPSIHAFPRSC
jgi:hypothetical protein